MSTARTILALVLLAVVGVVGYQIGVSQNIAAQLPAAASGVPGVPPYYWYGPQWGFGFGFFGLLFPLFFFLLIFGLFRAAIGGGRGWGHGGRYGSRYGQIEEIHRELHGDKPQSGGTSSTST